MKTFSSKQVRVKFKTTEKLELLMKPLDSYDDVISRLVDKELARIKSLGSLEMTNRALLLKKKVMKK